MFSISSISSLYCKRPLSSNQKDAYWFAQTNWQSYFLLNPYLYRRNSLKSGSFALPWAAERGVEATARAYLSEGSDVAMFDEFGRNPLSWAARNGHEAVVRALLSTGKIDIDGKGWCSRTPLSWAAGNGHVAIVRALLYSRKVNIDLPDSKEQTPLSWAARNDYTEVAKLLLETGHADRVSIVLESKGVEDNAKNHYGQTPLFPTAGKGHITVVKALTRRNEVDVNVVNYRLGTPLSLAAKNGHLEWCQVFSRPWI